MSARRELHDGAGGLFSTEAGITKERATEILSTHYTHYPEIQMWHQQVRQTLLSLGKLVTPFGRDRIFYAARAELQLTGKLSGAHWRDAVSYVPQATMPDVLNHGMLKTWQQLEYLWLHHQGHDSCMVSVPTDKLGEACQALKDNLTMPIVVNGHMLTIPVEVSWGFLWHPMMAWKGEQYATQEEERYAKWVEQEMTEQSIVSDLIGLV